MDRGQREDLRERTEKKELKKNRKKLENKVEVKGLSISHGCGINLKILFLPPTAIEKKEEKSRQRDTYKQTLTQQQELTPGGMDRLDVNWSLPRGEVCKERKMEKDGELFLPMYGSQACRPLIPLTPNGMFLFISPSLPPSISICHPPPCRAWSFPLHHRLPSSLPAPSLLS